LSHRADFFLLCWLEAGWKLAGILLAGGWLDVWWLEKPSSRKSHRADFFFTLVLAGSLLEASWMLAGWKLAGF
jgi:hypothetical protein